MSAAYSAEADKGTVQTASAQKKPQKSTEALYHDALSSIQAKDAGGAEVVLAGMNPFSPYAKLLRAQIAVLNRDFETSLRLLIPLQAETGLQPEAIASLHATLALAYESQENILGALEQRVQAEPFLEANAIQDNQSVIWNLLSSQIREVLIEMRGESSSTVVQGWIDLALAASYPGQQARNVAHWRSAYPDHPVTAALLERIVSLENESRPVTSTSFSGKIALLLPFDHPVYASVANAVRSGVMAAQAADSSKPEVRFYATGGAEGVVGLYQQAVKEGATFVIGPLTRDEVSQFAAEPLSVPMLALNQPEGVFKPQPNLNLFGLSAEGESRQVARLARDHGMQRALIIAAATPLAERMAKAFGEEWRLLDGTVTDQLTLPAPEVRADFKAQATRMAVDMIFLATDAVQAREVRPWLDPAIPTYGTSHLYDGAGKSLQNQDLLAVHFVDAPWLIEPDNPEYAVLRPAEPLQSAELQRLYALGLDAYRLVAVLQNSPVVGKQLLQGATGSILLQENNVLTRELTPAQFRREGVMPERVE